MVAKIEQPIVDYEVVKEEESSTSEDYRQFQGPIERPESLQGKTYKIRPGADAAAMYVTVNYIEKDNGFQPFEVFINSKNVSHFSWVVALTRMISGIFRSGGEYLFILDELKTVADPSGPYIVPGSGFMSSVPAHLGRVLEESFKEFGVLETKSESNEKEMNAQDNSESNEEMIGYTGIPCPQCNMPTLKIDGGCKECLNSDCDYSGCE